MLFMGRLQSSTKLIFMLSGPPQKRSVVKNSPTTRVLLTRSKVALSIEQFPKTLPTSTNNLAFTFSV